MNISIIYYKYLDHGEERNRLFFRSKLNKFCKAFFGLIQLKRC